MRNLNILARRALLKVTTDPRYSATVRVDFDRPWFYKFSLAYKNVILFEEDLEITEKETEAIEKKFLTTIQYVLIEEDFKEWIDFIVEFDSKALPNYANDEAQIYWTGLEATIYAPSLEAAQRAYEEWTGEKADIHVEDGYFYAS